MKFLLLSHHIGRDIPENEKLENGMAMEEWFKLLQPIAALPINGGKTISSGTVGDYQGDIGGTLIFEAESMQEAVDKAKQSPGLKYGWTHDVLEEMKM